MQCNYPACYMLHTVLYAVYHVPKYLLPSCRPHQVLWHVAPLSPIFGADDMWASFDGRVGVVGWSDSLTGLAITLSQSCHSSCPVTVRRAMTAELRPHPRTAARSLMIKSKDACVKFLAHLLRSTTRRLCMYCTSIDYSSLRF